MFKGLRHHIQYLAHFIEYDAIASLIGHSVYKMPALCGLPFGYKTRNLFYSPKNGMFIVLQPQTALHKIGEQIHCWCPERDWNVNNRWDVGGNS